MRMLAADRHYSTWGNTAHVAVPARVRFDPEGTENRIGALCRAIERKNRPLSVANCRFDGTAVEGGRKTADHYQLTIGKALKSGGFAVEGSLWVSMRRKGE